ncbi:MAG: hypothetical protein WC592_04575 [Candidatus Omnitrophota bacterium]
MKKITMAAGVIIKWLAIAAVVVLLAILAMERGELVTYTLIMAILLLSADKINKGSKSAWWFLVTFLLIPTVGIAIMLLLPTQKFPHEIFVMSAMLIIFVPLLIILLLDPPSKWNV